MKIVGAGISGLIAANMLRHKSPMVLEQQTELPNNHSAVLRFRSPIIGDVTGIEFKKVDVIKASLPWRNAIADALAYADKNTGALRSDRSIPADIVRAERYIAPPDFIEQLAAGIDISYNVHYNFNQQKFNKEIDADQLEKLREAWGSGAESILLLKNVEYEGPIISTIPMPALMDILDYQGARAEFQYIHGTNLIANVERCDAYVSLYTPSPFYPFSRISLTGNEFVAEVPSITEIDDVEIIYAAAALLGIPNERLSSIHTKRQLYSKIQPINDDIRKRFITWASDQHGIYSLGRYACWRPSLLLDDLVQDIRLIERWINGGSYARKLHENRRQA